MGTYRTIYTMKPYNDLENYLKGKKKLDEFSCVNATVNFGYLDGKIGYDTPYNMLTVVLGDKPIVQLTTYDEKTKTIANEQFYEEIDHVAFDNMITIYTTEGTIIEIVSTKEIERQFEGIVKFKD